MNRSHRQGQGRCRLGAGLQGPLGLLAALVLISAISIAGFSQGFGQPGAFGDTDEPREFETVQPDQRSSNTYFIHDQLLKIAIVGGLSILALGVLVFRGIRYRKGLLLLSIGLVGFYLGGVLCPLSSVQNVFLKWHTGYFLLFLIPVLLALTVGRVFCGYVCPFGAIQELLHVRRWALRIPTKWSRPLGAIKYLVLIYLVIRVIVAGTGILQGYTPFKALFEWGGTPLTFALTAIFAGMSIVLWRPFCKVFCPLGALLSVLSRFSLLRLGATADCVSCGRCTSRCPAEACQNGEIRSANCFLCGECLKACPTASLRFTRRWPSIPEMFRRIRALRKPGG
ncbi:4Fe-4S binding protein [Candidatus Bipolaricaulota bacterium]|nr:4Fe-4S binding protein [Candidatus Bipolaricaulota bacterium]